MGDTKQTKQARREAKRAKLTAELGGKCVDCGRTEDLEYHHLDPTTKSFDLGGNLDRSMAVLMAEAAKCVLLCLPCHDVRHAIEKLQATYVEADRTAPSPAALRAAAARRVGGSNREARSLLGVQRPTDSRRRSITRSIGTPTADGLGVSSLSITVTGVGPIDTTGEALLAAVSPGDTENPTPYSISNVTVGEPLGPTYTQVSLKLPDDPLGNALAAALADGVGPTISAIARDWMTVGAERYLASKAGTAAVCSPEDILRGHEDLTNNPEGTTE